MKILLWSDLHAHNWEQFSTRLPNGRNSRLQHCLDVIHQVTALVEAKRADATIFLGDLFHARNKIDVDVYTSVHEALQALSCISSAGGAAKPILMVGNHDQYTRMGEVHSLSPLADSCQIVNHPTARLFDDVETREQVLFYLYPHTTDIAELKRSISVIAGQDTHDVPKVLCIHQAVKEGRIGPSDTMLAEVPLSVSDLHLDSFKYCFAGDYHKRQWISRFHYVGSPLQLTFGERDETKAFTILDTKTWECEEVETEAPKFFVFPSLDAYKAASEARSYEQDFVRIEAKSSTEVDAIQKTAPSAQTILVKEQTELSRVSKEALTHDRLLLEAYSSQMVKNGDIVSHVEMGLSYLQGSE